MGTAAQTNKQRQAAFRERQRLAGAQRLNVWVSGVAHALLTRKAARDGISAAKLIERLALGIHAINHQEKL